MTIFISFFFYIFTAFSGAVLNTDLTSQKVEFVSPKNDSFSLAKYKGKVVVLNFWASWSKASRLENKNLVRIYEKYKGSSKIVFVSVSLDTDEASWKTAIEEDELQWKNQYCDFMKYDSPLAKKYKINTLPVICIYDKAGNLVKSASKVQELETDIDGLLK